MSNVDPTPERESEGRSPSRGRRFNPRLAAIYATGALAVVLAVALVLSFVGRSSEPTPAATDVSTIRLGAERGSFTATTLPNAGLLTVDGKVTDLGAVADGRPTMVNFFSSSCTACRSEMPALEALHERAGDAVQIVGVNLGDSEKITKSFVDQTGVTYTIVRDPTTLLVERLNITAQPLTLWVDADGTIVGHRYGAMTETEMRSQLDEHLGVSLPSS